MFPKLRFEIVDQGITHRPANKRFKAIAPNVHSQFRTRNEAVIWLQGCYRFIASMEGFPVWPMPDFKKVDSIEVEHIGVMS